MAFFIRPTSSRDHHGLARWLKARRAFAIRRLQNASRLRMAKLRSIERSYLVTFVGHLTFAWAMMERALDDLVLEIFSHGGTQFQTVLPVQFGNKIDFLRRTRGLLQNLEPFCDRMQAIQTEAKTLKAIRIDLTHGLVRRTNREAIWTTNRIKFHGATRTTETKDIQTKQIGDACEALMFLAERIMDLTVEIERARPIFDRPNLSDQLGVRQTSVKSANRLSTLPL